jgi:hypothetical protein
MKKQTFQIIKIYSGDASRQKIDFYFGNMNRGRLEKEEENLPPSSFLDSHLIIR